MSSKLYFQATDGTNGKELWVSNGTAGGTSMLKDIRSGSGDSSPQYLAVMDSKLYFQANDGTHGQELWVSDGTAGGTSMLKDIKSGSQGSTPQYLAA
eukprot:CAMPEP_0183790378 /NCGR_PEP_ID=MMETSP0803_2-20130417/1008_1 /TAXON_ID=195967 /ORGANISM="Crustomastix stigmata, Strain CCMP3273" /LENGTH=96 /DNA_ID=CAMNT_0026034593 /DNA_START=15 /DNA_END=302 /DNA_ORIENTATION=-